MDLNLVWFILLCILLAGYAILDGFDLGIGIIHPFLKNEKERKVAIKAVGPLWDGNEVWLVTFGGALFAGFPEAYATILSAMYLPIMMLLFCLILRAVSIDFYTKVESKFWRKLWDVGFTISSLGATYIFGVAAGNLIQGLDLNERGDFTGRLIDLVGLYTLATGLLAVATFALHGTLFLFLKSTGTTRENLKVALWRNWGLFLVVYILVSLMTLIENEHVVATIKLSPWAIPIVLLNVLCVANIPRSIYRKKYGQAFVSSCINIACLVGLFAISTFPNLVFSTTDFSSLTIYNAASGKKTLGILCLIAAIGAPMIISYTAIIYWTFRAPIEEPE